MSFKTTYATKILNKKFGKLNRDISVFNYEKSKNIGILWHVKDKEAFNYINKNLDTGKLNISTLCLKDKNEGEIPHSYNEKDTSWLGFPKAKHVKEFMLTEFDLLINVSLDESFSLKVIAALSKARFKIGAANNKVNYYDLSIDVSKNPNSLYLAEQQLFYLKKLKINN